MNSHAVATPLVELTQVRKSYPHPAGAVEVLKGVDAKAMPGETLAIIGPSGSGKSTLLTLLAGLDRASSGRIALAGQDLGQLDEAALGRFRAQTLGIVFQQFHLMRHLTALENAALPLRLLRDPLAYDKAEAALTSVGLSHRKEHAPHQMSGGECQRVAIARALVAKPRLLLADEPSGNLDVKTGETVMKLIFDLVASQGMTLILVTHNEELARACRHRLVLSGGRLLDAP